MKNLAGLLFVLVVMGCGQRLPTIEPSRLLGTWNASLNDGKIYSRWTFGQNYLYRVSDSLQLCSPAQSQPYQYWLEQQVLVVRYAGFTTGLIPIPDERYSLEAVSPARFVLEKSNGQYLMFDKCP